MGSLGDRLFAVYKGPRKGAGDKSLRPLHTPLYKSEIANVSHQVKALVSESLGVFKGVCRKCMHRTGASRRKDTTSVVRVYQSSSKI